MNQSTMKLASFEIISSLGLKVFSFACAFYLLQMSHTSMIYSIYLALIVSSTILSEPILGVFADKLNNKKLIFFAQVINVMLLILFAAFNLHTVYFIVALGVFLNLTDGVVSIVINANLKYISGDSLERFIPIRQMYKIGMNFLGPILGGMLIAFFTIENLAFFNAFTEALTIILLFYISLKKMIEAEEESLYHSFKEGWRYTLRQSNLLRFMMISCILNFLMNSVVVGVPVAAIHYFKLSSKQFGLIEGAFTLGMFVLSLVLSLLPISKNLKRSFQISILMQLGILISLSLMFIGDLHAKYTLILMICIYFVMGLSVTLAGVPYSIYLQNSVDESYKGRVLSLNEMLVQSLMPLSFLIFGFLFHFSMVGIFIGVATLMCFIFIYFSRRVNLTVE